MSETVNPITEFDHIFATKTDLEQKAADAPELLKDILSKAVNQADDRLRELAADPAVRAHYVEQGGPAVAAMVELEQIAPSLEELGMQDSLQEKRRELQEQLPENLRQGILSYFIGESVQVAPQEPEAATATAGTTETETPAELAASAETTRPKVIVKIDPNNNISINDNSRSLSRRVKNPRTSQALVRRLRADALRFLAQHQGEMLLRGPIAKALGLSESHHDRTLWSEVVRTFLEDAPKYGSQPLIVADTSTPKRYYYGINPALEVTVTDTDRILRPKDESVFMLPNGGEVVGKAGVLMNMLARASSERPLTSEDIIGKGRVYEEAEAAEHTTPRSQLLSSLLKGVRGHLEGTDYVVLSTEVGHHPDTKRPIFGYYMVENAELAAQERAERAARVGRAAVGGAETTETEPAQPETEIDPNAPLTLVEAAVIAGFLDYYGDRIEAHGIARIPSETLKELSKQAVERCGADKLRRCNFEKIRQQAFEKVFALLDNDDKLLEEAMRFNEGQDEGQDPRANLLLELATYGQHDAVDYIKRLLTSEPGQKIVFDESAGSKHSFSVVRVKTMLTDKNGHSV